MQRKNSFNIIVTNIAYQELNEIYYYISNILNNVSAADRLYKNILENLVALRKNPYLYPVIVGYENYRRIIIKNYIIVYRVDKLTNTVYIVHIVYKRNNYLKML